MTGSDIRAIALTILVLAVVIAFTILVRALKSARAEIARLKGCCRVISVEDGTTVTIDGRMPIGPGDVIHIRGALEDSITIRGAHR